MDRIAGASAVGRSRKMDAKKVSKILIGNTQFAGFLVAIENGKKDIPIRVNGVAFYVEILKKIKLQ